MAAIDDLTMLIALTHTKREEEEQASPPVTQSATDFPTVPVSGIGPIRDLFIAVGRPDEMAPSCFVLGLDCSDNDSAALTRDARSDVREVLALYPDHLLLVGNPTRGASVGTTLKLLATSFSRAGKAKNTPHSRIANGEISSAAILSEHPAWDFADQTFLRVSTVDREVWFWVDLPVTSNEDLQKAIDAIHG